MENETIKGITDNLPLIKTIVAGLTIALGVIFPSISIGKLATKAMESIGRNPECASKLQAPMILSIAFLEAIAIYVLVVALIVKFV